MNLGDWNWAVTAVVLALAVAGLYDLLGWAFDWQPRSLLSRD